MLCNIFYFLFFSLAFSTLAFLTLVLYFQHCFYILSTNFGKIKFTSLLTYLPTYLPTYLCTYLLTYSLTHSLTPLLARSLARWLTDWLAGWLAGWLTDWLTYLQWNNHKWLVYLISLYLFSISKYRENRYKIK